MSICPNCNSSNIIQKGIRKNRYLQRQMFLCKNCKRKFSEQTPGDQIKYPQSILNIFKSSLNKKTRSDIKSLKKKMINFRSNLIYHHKESIKWYKKNEAISGDDLPLVVTSGFWFRTPITRDPKNRLKILYLGASHNSYLHPSLNLRKSGQKILRKYNKEVAAWRIKIHKEEIKILKRKLPPLSTLKKWIKMNWVFSSSHSSKP